ncbi:hypothetical protein FGO68_gene16336 [Halteria grandinella]|uniref:Uncharacterized protein n=1 Tax=Halteria grandinella TaxID=5974 RepID=A0A8J8SYS7_HALGN|nr:hypothetical protein FGO68_gene16336 [Halteria grandinella]
MFKREIKRQFNENKYNVLTAKEIAAAVVRLPEAPGRHPGPDGARLQLHQEMVHLPPPPQGRGKAHVPPQRGASPLRETAPGCREPWKAIQDARAVELSQKNGSISHIQSYRYSQISLQGDGVLGFWG